MAILLSEALWNIWQREKMLGLRMKDEQKFTVSHIGCRVGWHWAVQTYEHGQRHMFNHVFEDNEIIQNDQNFSWMEGRSEKMGQEVRSEMKKAYLLYTRVWSSACRWMMRNMIRCAYQRCHLEEAKGLGELVRQLFRGKIEVSFWATT